MAYQETEAGRVEVRTAFMLDEAITHAEQSFGFEVGRYDATRTLVLDPAYLLYCGYIGGAGDDWAQGIAVDAAGNAYIVGTAMSSEQTFPVVVGPDLTHNGGGPYDAFVAKVNAQGTGLIYCGYIGGAVLIDVGTSIAVDAAGNAYVTGRTSSTEQTFPVTVGPDLTQNGAEDAFVAKVNAQGTALDYCGYIGGIANDQGNGIAVDGAGNAYVTGSTLSSEQTFPVAVGPDLTYNGFGDAFVAKVNKQGSALVYCGYIGGTDPDYGNGIAVDGLDAAYVTGEAISTERSFPVKVGPDVTQNGANDAFVAKVNKQGTALVYCGYIGGVRLDWGNGVAVDAAGNAYVTGRTSSTEQSFPVKVGPDVIQNGANDAFVAKVNAQGSTLVYCGYIGGTTNESGNGIAVDAAGNAHVTGDTDSTEQSFPVTVGPDVTQNGASDAFVAKVNAQGTAFVYCGYIGGGFNDAGEGIAVDASGNDYVTGWTCSDEQTFPVTVGPDLTFNAITQPVRHQNAFVAKVSLTRLQGTGTPRPGFTVNLALEAINDAARPYQLASSLGMGPIPIGNRQIGLSADDLLVVTVGNFWPWIFSGYRGVLDAKGEAQAAIHIPNVPALIGLRIHSAFVTLDPTAPWGIRSISDTETFTITK